MLFYITWKNFEDFSGTGKEKKIKGQIDAMKQSLGKAYYTKYSNSILYLMDGEEVIEREVTVTRRDSILALCHWMQKYGVTYTYIRYPRSSKWFLDLLRYQNEHQIKTVLEIATYPYDGEMKEGVLRTEDFYYRQRIGEYVDRIATYSADTRIWDITCINLKNGIADLEVCANQRVKEANSIVLIAVSCMMDWHGYERVLEGMYLYYKQGGVYDIKFKLIGSGPEEARYKELVKKYNLDSKVEFVGRIGIWERERLNEQYASSDVAVGSLGRYKNGIEEGSPIKDAEYCAKGLPIISGIRDLGFPPNWEYIMNLPNTPEPVDMNAVIAFYKKVSGNVNYKEEMQNYAKRNLTWNSIMRPVCEYFLSEGKDENKV